MLEELKQIQLIRQYIEDKQTELEKYNLEHGIDESVEVNGRPSDEPGHIPQIFGALSEEKSTTTSGDDFDRPASRAY